jgi:hypothetical protein
MQFSMQSLLLLCVYGGICSLNYAGSNLWIGTATVVATIAFVSYTTIHAFHSRRGFPLAFSIAASAWMIFWLGFYAETSPSQPPWKLPQHIYELIAGINVSDELKKIDLNAPSTSYATMHSIHVSVPMATHGSPPPTPAFSNAIRLAVCLTSLVFGFCAAAVVILLRKMKRASSRGARGLHQPNNLSAYPENR